MFSVLVCLLQAFTNVLSENIISFFKHSPPLSGDQTCNSNMCQNLANGFSDHATLINNERSRWGVSSSVVSSSLSDCVSQSQTCATALSFPSQCIQDEGLSGSSTIFGYTYYANSAFTDYEAIQYHLTNLFTIGDTYSCSTNSFSGGETSAANLYRQYISEDSNMNIGLSVLRDCPSGDDHFMVVVLFNPKLPDNTRPVTSCPSSGASCTPNTCTPTGSCYLHGTPAGCNAGAMDCACSEGQICNEESGFCELCASCMAQEFNCGSVASCSGLTESCGECEGDESCYMKDGETGGVCCSPQSSCDDFCGTLSAEENCGLALECSCSEARVATDSFPVCECDDNQCFPSVAESGCIPNSNCAPCQEGSVCCVLDTDGPTCAPEGSGCVCPGGAVWVNGECTVPTPGVSSSLQAERDCGSVWYEQVGAQSGSGRETFSPSLEDCSIVAKKTDLDCPEGLPYCANLYIFGGFSSSNPGDGVSVEVKGFSEGFPLSFFLSSPFSLFSSPLLSFPLPSPFLIFFQSKALRACSCMETNFTTRMPSPVGTGLVTSTLRMTKSARASTPSNKLEKRRPLLLTRRGESPLRGTLSILTSGMSSRCQGP